MVDIVGYLLRKEDKTCPKITICQGEKGWYSSCCSREEGGPWDVLPMAQLPFPWDSCRSQLPLCCPRNL